MVNELANKADYDAFLQSHNDGIAVICFTAQWNGPCRMFAPEFDKIAKEYDNVAFARIDTEGNDKVVHKEGVELLPAFCFYKKGHKVGKTVRGNASTVRSAIDTLRVAP